MQTRLGLTEKAVIGSTLAPSGIPNLSDIFER
jgi:hypothetical protein